MLTRRNFVEQQRLQAENIGIFGQIGWTDCSRLVGREGREEVRRGGSADCRLYIIIYFKGTEDINKRNHSQRMNSNGQK